MKKIRELASYFMKSLFRERVILVMVILFPILLVIAGSASAPSGSLPMELDGEILTPAPDARELSVALYSLTAVVLVASVVSFFLGFNTKPLIPRLRQVKYSNTQIALAFVTVMVLVNIIMSIVIGIFSLVWVEPANYLGYFGGIFLGSIIFSTLGLIIAELVDTSTFGIYGILTMAIMDTGFVENPVYSRRYNDDFIFLMPSHESLQMMLRSIYDTSVSWFEGLWIIVIYELILIVIYGIILKYELGFSGKN